MHNFIEKSKKFAVLLALTLLIAGNVRADDDASLTELEDGIVEDVQDEPTAAGDSEIAYESPKYNPDKFHFVDHFDNIEESSKKWIKSKAKKDDTAEEIAKYDGVWEWEAPQRIVWKKDTGLVLKSKAKHAAISAPLSKPFTFKDAKPLVVQYEVTMQEGQECGGSYIKLLSASKHTKDLTQFNDKTPYTIMFGPDKCGNDIKLHFIFRHVNPINGTISEKHCRKPKNRLEEPFKDKLPHLYQLVVRPDNTFEIRVDHKVVNEGSLLSEFTPPVNPPREIDDPSDIKPSDWDEREKIADPSAQKPDDWDEDAPPQIPDVSAVMPEGWLEDEPEMIPDPSAIKPEDWDAEIDGEWEAPLVDNPVCEKAPGCGKWKAPLIPNQEYKGKWRAPLIDNPNYNGKWAPRKIPNPDFFEDFNPFLMTPIDAVGIELWSMSNNILFDNLIITDNIDLAKEFAANSFDLKRKYIAKESKTLWHRLMRHMNYKPGWWALYFLYLLIPVSCYVLYLYKRAKEETILSKIQTFAEENPWTWKVGLVLVVAFIAFNVYRIFSLKPDTKDDDADAKKTDAPQPDDEEDQVEDAGGDSSSKENDAPQPENEEAQIDDAGGDNSEKKQNPKKKKSDLDIKDDVYDEVQAQERQPKLSDDADDTEKEVVAQTEESSTAKTTRKRQVRKD